MSGAAPTLIGGSFTPTWHVPSCPCDGCIKTRAQLDACHRAFLEIQADPIKKAAFDAALEQKAAEREKKRRRRPTVRKRRHTCDCPCRRRY